MPQGFQVWNSSGTLVFDSNDTVGGQVVDVVTETSSSATYNYSAFAGYTVEIINNAGYNTSPPTVSYASGYPSVTVYGYYEADLAATYYILVL